MALPLWREEPISRAHDRSRFDCGVPALNEYLKRHARKNHASGYTTTFVAVPVESPSVVMGYYSLSNAHVEFDHIPADLVTKIPRYPVSAVRLARLACDRQFKGQGLGARLLLAAAERAVQVSKLSGAAMLLIDAKDENAAAFYEANDAVRLHDDPLRLVIPLAAIESAITDRKPSSEGKG